MKKVLVITVQIRVTDIESLNMEELMSGASQQGIATLIEFETEEEKEKY